MISRASPHVLTAHVTCEASVRAAQHAKTTWRTTWRALTGTERLLPGHGDVLDPGHAHIHRRRAVNITLAITTAATATQGQSNANREACVFPGVCTRRRTDWGGGRGYGAANKTGLAATHLIERLLQGTGCRPGSRRPSPRGTSPPPTTTARNRDADVTHHNRQPRQLRAARNHDAAPPTVSPGATPC